MPILQRKRHFFIWETKLLCFRPQLHNIRRGDAGLDSIDGNIEVITTASVSIDLRFGSTAHRQRTIIASTIAIETMQNVVEGQITGAKDAIAKDVRMGIAALARNSVDALYMFRSHAVQNIVNQPDTF